MLLGQAVTSMLEHFCLTRNGRIPRNKELIGTAGAHDPRVAQMAAAFFSAATPMDRLHLAEALAEFTIGVRGFFPWDSGPDPVPPPGG
jgi:hypothetical protein